MGQDIIAILGLCSKCTHKTKEEIQKLRFSSYFTSGNMEKMYLFSTQQTAQTHLYKMYLVGRGPILYTTPWSQVGRVFCRPEPLLVYGNEAMTIFVSP